jgi:hypothetical protein
MRRIRLVLAFVSSALAALAYTADREEPQSILDSGPIATVGHGVLIGHDGKVVNATPALALETQRHYLDRLQENATTEQQAELTRKRIRVFGQDAWDERDRAVANSALIGWLLDNTRPSEHARLASINAALRERMTDGGTASPRILAALAREGLAAGTLQRRGPGGAFKTNTVTTAGGADYIDECAAAGVPIPPAFGAPGWTFQGDLNTELINASQDAKVWTYESTSPEGICYALPRHQGGVIKVLGVICQGKQTSNACFWDNANVAPGTVVPLENFVGGADLFGASGGVCSDCHAGENPFIIHPGTPLDLGGAITTPNQWYKPRVAAGWPQNKGPTNLLSCIALGPSDASCLACHGDGSGRRFPYLSKELNGFCWTVLSGALAKTMPPGNFPAGPAYEKHFQAMGEACLRYPTEGDDYDQDCVKNVVDNCPTTYNPGQEDGDTDGRGDVCDNCPEAGNADQLDTNGDGQGNVCDDDDDGDFCKDSEDDKPLSDSSVVGWRLALNCPQQRKNVWGWDGNDSDGDGLRNCKDKDDDNDGVADAGDSCPVNKPNPNGAPYAGAECEKSPMSCPLQVWWDVCMLGGCNEQLVKIVSVVNPDPTVVIDQFAIRGRELYLMPGAKQTIEAIEDAVQGKVAAAVTIAGLKVAASAPMSPAQLPPGNRLRIEIWSRDSATARGTRLVTVAEYDPNAVRYLGRDARAALRVTLDDEARTIAVLRTKLPAVAEERKR